MNSYGDRYVHQYLQHQVLIDLGNGDNVIVASVQKVPCEEDALIDHKQIVIGKGDDLIDARFGGLGGDGI